MAGSWRNPYDKLGHFFRGAGAGAGGARILLRGGYVQGRKMLGFVVCCIALAISAVYELIEWWAALALGEAPTSFSAPGATRGILSPTCSAPCSARYGLLLFAGWQDRQIRRLRR